jgi:hypothetical protein
MLNNNINNFNQTQKNKPFFMRGATAHLHQSNHTSRSAKENKLSKSSNSSFTKDKKIIDKFYMPFIEKKSYNTNLNQNVAEIKKMTRTYAFMNHYLKKKKKEINGIAKNLIIYNNPGK